jgi:mRNA-degrading endonuclease RelE of RelBE toxin-antitoxin system
MAYNLIFTEDFLKDISKLDQSVKVHLKNLYDKIKENPRRFKPLRGDANSYRLRIMNFRLKYRVVGEEIHMYRFENRDKIYGR